jgi:hypothetical protein
LLYFVALLQERRADPSPGVDAKIKKLEDAIYEGREFAVPSLH